MSTDLSRRPVDDASVPVVELGVTEAASLAGPDVLARLDSSPAGLSAAGARRRLDRLLVAYRLANVVGSLPISPGGLGVIEGVLIPSLVGFGAPSTVALLGVVSWRLFEFWLPIPLAGSAYLSLRAQVTNGPARTGAHPTR